MLCSKFFRFLTLCPLPSSLPSIIYIRIHIDFFPSNHQTLPGTQWYYEARRRFWRFSFRDTSDMSQHDKSLHIFYASPPRIYHLCDERPFYGLYDASYHTTIPHFT